jgi:competence protein ComEA
MAADQPPPDQPPPDRAETRRGEVLHRADQAGVAALVLLALVALGCYYLAHGGCRGELIDIEHAAPRRAKFLVDINRANWPEFAQLPGVGETLAKRIVKARSEHGPFRDQRQLLDIPGIGPSTLARMEPYLMPLPADGSQ